MNKVRAKTYHQYLSKNLQLALPTGQADLLLDGKFLNMGSISERSGIDCKQHNIDCRQHIEETLEATSWLVLAPAMYSFVMWTLQKAEKDKVERLYFLARDGYLMYKVARLITNSKNLPFECCYLYCSRYSLRTPLFHLDVEDALDYICRNSIKLNLAIILKRSGLSRLQREEVTKELALDFQSEEDIPYAKLKRIKQSLQNCELFINYLIENSRQLLPAFKGYLQQEGLLDGAKCAIVDSGWTGSTQKNLNQALHHFGIKDELLGYYWGLYTLPSKEGIEKYHGYYFMPDKNIKEKVYFSNSLFEAIYSAPHGMTLGYRRWKGKYAPFFLPVKKEVETFQLKIEEVMLQYVKIQLEKRQALVEFNPKEAKSTIFHILKLFMTSPTKEEVECFGEIAFSDDVFEDIKQPIAAKLSKKDLNDNKPLSKILAMIGLKKGKIKESGWYEGSVVRSREQTKKYLRQYAAYKRLLYIRTAIRWKLKR